MPQGRGTAGRRFAGMIASPLMALPVLAAAVVAGCYPNPDALRTSSSGAGGSTTPSGGSTGGGGAMGNAGASGTAGHSGSGGSGAGGALGMGGHVGTGGNSGVGGSGGFVGSGLVLMPDPTGWIAPGSNALGLQGGWYGFSDGIGPDGTTATGGCEMAGHPANACSLLTSPSQTDSGFPNTGGKMCAAGIAARVVNNLTTGLPDYGAIYGASIGFDFNTPGMSAAKGTFNALANSITGIQFDIDVVPSNGLRIEFVTPGTDLGFGGPAYWAATSAYPPSPVFVGTNRIYWADVIAPYGLGLDPTQLVSMDFSIPTTTLSSDSFHFCISNVTLIRDAGPLGRTCTSSTPYPVFCPAANGVPATCWTAGTNCNSTTSCSGVYRSCLGQAPSEYFDCSSNMCLPCSGSFPVGCPARGSVPATCWPANTVCSTVADCGAGDYESCTDSSLIVDCTTLTCN